MCYTYTKLINSSYYILDNIYYSVTAWMHIVNKCFFNTSRRLRIISGQWRGRKLPVLDQPGLRPTTDRLRETLFNWLTPVIRGASCLDCFAGTGALGIEAISRYASSLVLLEQNYITSVQLRKNIQLLQADCVKVFCVNTLAWLCLPGSLFNIVFIDPPFYHGIINKVVRLLEYNDKLQAEAWIYIESENNTYAVDIPSCWKLYRQKISKKVAASLYYRSTSYKM